MGGEKVRSGLVSPTIAIRGSVIKNKSHDCTATCKLSLKNKSQTENFSTRSQQDLILPNELPSIRSRLGPTGSTSFKGSFRTAANFSRDFPRNARSFFLRSSGEIASMVCKDCMAWEGIAGVAPPVLPSARRLTSAHFDLCRRTRDKRCCAYSQGSQRPECQGPWKTLQSAADVGE